MEPDLTESNVLDFGGWEVMLLVIAALVLASFVYAFVWTVRRFTRAADQDVDALRARVESIERRLGQEPGR